MLNNQYKKLIVLFIPGLFMLLFQLLGEEFAGRLSFMPEHIVDGQWWRVLTGHFVHFTFYHTAMNVFGLVMVVYFIFVERPIWAFYSGLLLICVFTSLGLYLDGGLHEYRGFSGVFYGVLVYACLLNFRDNRLMMSAIIAIVLVKIILEQRPGYDVNYLKDQIAVAVAIDAHLWGVVSGIGVGALYLCYIYCFANKKNEKKAQ